MRRIRILSIIIFIAALAVFGAYKFSEIKNSDRTGPKITMDEETITVASGAGEEELLAGIYAEDKKDGDVTDSLIVETESNFVEEGRRLITVAAFDSDNHVTKATREIIYSDYQPPTFSLSEPLRFPLDTQNILTGLKAQDVLDGDITGNIKISTEYTLKASEAGEYPMMFTVANSAGDVSSLPVTVEIYDQKEETQKPHITLSSYLVYTAAGTPLNPWDYVQEIMFEGRDYIRDADGVLRDPDPGERQERTSISADEVSISEDVDYNTPGVYEITYRITNENEMTGTVRLIVVVSA